MVIELRLISRNLRLCLFREIWRGMQGGLSIHLNVPSFHKFNSFCKAMNADEHMSEDLPQVLHKRYVFLHLYFQLEVTG